MALVDSHEQPGDFDVHPHVTPVSTYVAVLGGLMVLTVLTVAVSYFTLGSPWDLVVALLIATMKGGMVVAYFMHMKYETKFNVLVFLGSLVFLAIFITYTVNDTNYRAAVDPHNGDKVDPRTGQFAYGTPEALIESRKAEQEASEGEGGEGAEGGGGGH